MIETVECDNDVTVSVSGELTHKCPYRDEIDHGQADITWTIAGRTLELHSLAEYLTGWQNAQLSHEQVTDRIRHDLSAIDGITDVQVSTSWNTSGLRVSVMSGGGMRALLRQPVRAEGGASDA
jgi:NADPH-dependent 7-cyano-7-deazaguanine reductase QueF